MTGGSTSVSGSSAGMGFFCTGSSGCGMGHFCTSGSSGSSGSSGLGHSSGSGNSGGGDVADCLCLIALIASFLATFLVWLTKLARAFLVSLRQKGKVKLQDIQWADSWFGWMC